MEGSGVATFCSSSRVLFFCNKINQQRKNLFYLLSIFFF